MGSRGRALPQGVDSVPQGADSVPQGVDSVPQGAVFDKESLFCGGLAYHRYR